MKRARGGDISFRSTYQPPFVFRPFFQFSLTAFRSKTGGRDSSIDLPVKKAASVIDDDLRERLAD